jgi:hypothetical protein
MAKESAIWKRARCDLVLADEAGNRDVFLWEHCQRVARNATRIVEFIGAAARRVDHAALEAAALYHEAGWACQFREGIITRADVFARPPTEQRRELAAVQMTRSLAGCLTPRSLETAAAAVRQFHEREVRGPEAQILADAENLDEIGVLSFWNAMRRATFEGKGIETVFLTWRRQREFRFWEARISKFVHFEPVRQIARQRLGQLDDFIALLHRHHAGEDLLDLDRARAPTREVP